MIDRVAEGDVALVTTGSTSTRCSWRVAIIGPLPPPPGGMANQTRQLAELLKAEGCDITVVRTNAPYQPAWVGCVKGLRALCRLIPYLVALWRTAGKVQIFHILANSGWSWHLITAPAVWIARLRNIPVVVNYRGGGAEKFFARSWRWIRPTLSSAAAVTVPSGFLADVFQRRGVESIIVPNIVDLTRFTPDSERTIRLVTEQDNWPQIIVTRNLEAIYDIGTALRAFQIIRKQYPKAYLSIAGEGPERKSLERLAAELGVQDAVIFTGRIDNLELPTLYRCADLMLNPSLVDNTPISVLEALASGVPVVSTNVGGIPYLVKSEQTALLVLPGDHQTMAAAAIRILEDENLRFSLINTGLQEVLKYEWPVVREHLSEVYKQALHNASTQ